MGGCFKMALLVKELKLKEAGIKIHEGVKDEVHKIKRGIKK